MNERIDKTRTIELAERQVKAGRIEEAIVEYKKLLAGDSPDLSVNNIIGDLYVQLGRNDEAIKAFQSVGGFYESKGYHSQALAIYKKINKLDSEHVISLVKMGDLYAAQGFAPEAKREYLKAEQILRRDKRVKELMFLYDKLIKLDRENVTFKTTLAELFRQEGFVEESVSQLNDASELLLARLDLDEAEKIVQQARQLKPDNERALTNFVEVLKRKGRVEEALDVVQEILSRDETNSYFENILGTLYLDSGELGKAEKIFSRILSRVPMDTRARIRLGKVYALQEQPEKAFDVMEPLIASLIKKQKEDKAIGLLGIVLGAKRAHLPALEKLAAIYKARNEKENQELVCRVILNEAQAKQLTEKMFVALSELMELCPLDETLSREYLELRKQMGFLDEKAERELLAVKDDEEGIDLLLAKVDLYIRQGLIRNARRLLETLSQRFPRSPHVLKKIEALEKVRLEITAEEIPRRVERVQEIETKIQATPELAKTLLAGLQDEEVTEKRVTAADIFAETDILPLPSEEGEERRYYDLTGNIEEELASVHDVFTRQLRGDISILEKDLSDIVRDFREEVRKKIDTKDFETRFHLGLAFLEQGLVEEAVEELLLASEDSGRALECYSIIGKAYRQKGEFEEALKWLLECLKLSKEGSEEFYAIEYEMACLYEEKGDRTKALEHFLKIREWNPAYRDVSKKLKGSGLNN